VSSKSGSCNSLLGQVREKQAVLSRLQLYLTVFGGEDQVQQMISFEDKMARMNEGALGPAFQ